MQAHPRISIRAYLAGLIALSMVSIGLYVTLASPPIDASATKPAKPVARKAAPNEKTIVLAGGCFWGMEAVFEHLKGVTDVVSGFAGGSADQARYEAVSSGTTSHAEVVKISYDPAKISATQLLKVYFSVAHDPTQLNRQGPDKGTQYRSAIFFANDEQKKLAIGYIEQLKKERKFAKPIVTQVTPLGRFYAAEDYHQNFIVRNPNYPYVVVHDLPKLAMLKKQFPDLYKP
jgi:peptide-methionine (S)-S-oxide reductase